MMQRLIQQGSRGTIRRRLAATATSSVSNQDPILIVSSIKTDSVNRDPIRLFSAVSTTSPTSKYALIDHSEAYEASMDGPHGRQLALARLEGQGKDDPPFDPFEEMEQQESMMSMEKGREIDEADDDDEKYGDEVIEAEYATEEEDEEEEEEDHGGDNDDDLAEEDSENALSIYNRDGSVRRSKSVLATLRAGFPSGGQFAVIELGGAQHKVTPDDLIVVNRLKPVEKYAIGTTHTLTDVLLVGSTHKTLVGMPTVPGAEVDVMVEEITRDKKLIIFKKRRRKNSQRKNGFRRDVTLLRVLDVRMPDEYKNHKHVQRGIVDELEEDLKPSQPGFESADLERIA